MKSIIHIFLALFLLIVPTGVTMAASLEERNKIDTKTSEGKNYEMEATKAFWSNAAFMRECAPPDSPIAEPLTILFVVKTDGSTGDISIIPDTAVARCIKELTAQRKFPIPPKEFVARIDLEFKP
jgi:hypothetical protein